MVLAAFALCPARQARAQFTLYGAPQAFSGAFYQVNPASGALTTVTTNTGAFYAGMDAQPGTGTLYAAGGSFLYTVNPATGQYTSMTTFTGDGAGDVFSLSFAPDGTLYGLGNGDGTLYTVDPTSGDTTLVGSSGQFIFGLEFGPAGVLYGCGIDLYVIDPATGAATDRGPLTTTGPLTLFNDLDFAPNGVMYGVTSALTTDSLYSIDLTAGAATLIGATGGNLDAIASVVPEPGTWAFLALGGARSLVIRTCRISPWQPCSGWRRGSACTRARGPSGRWWWRATRRSTRFTARRCPRRSSPRGCPPRPMSPNVV